MLTHRPYLTVRFVPERRYTIFDFHFPRLNNNALAIASREKAIVIAQKTPRGPISKW